MCTYSISVNDTLLERVRPAFANNEAIGQWMQTQIETMLQQMATEIAQNSQKGLLSQRLRGIAAHAPKDFDYKEELETRF